MRGSMVPLSKLGAWLLLMIISYVMVSAVAMASRGSIRSPTGAAFGVAAGEGVEQSCIEASVCDPLPASPCSQGEE